MKARTKRSRVSVRASRRSRPVRTTGRARQSGAAFALKSILVPIDFSADSKKALQYAVPFASQFGAKLIVLYVVESAAGLDVTYLPVTLDADKLTKSAKGRLDLLVRQARIDPGLIEKTLVRTGSPFHEICSAASGLKADLIVLATRGYSGLKHVLLGSTAERVVRHAPCPVLVVREREHEFVA